jgi:hypothetical protein
MAGLLLKPSAAFPQENQEFRRLDNPRAVIHFQVEQVFVAGHDVIGTGRLAACEDDIVVWIALYDIEIDVRHHMLAETGQRLPDQIGALPRATEIALQHFCDFIENGLGELQRERAFFDELKQLASDLSAREGGDMNIRIERSSEH